MSEENTVYRGERNDDGTVTVTADGRPLPPTRPQRLRDFETVFNWGYTGSRAAQLALALLLDVTRSIDLAEEHAGRFLIQFVSQWDGDVWTVTAGEIREWLNLSLTRCQE